MADRQFCSHRDRVVGRCRARRYGRGRLDERSSGSAVKDPHDLTRALHRHPDLGLVRISGNDLHPKRVHEGALLTVLQHRV